MQYNEPDLSNLEELSDSDDEIDIENSEVHNSSQNPLQNNSHIEDDIASIEDLVEKNTSITIDDTMPESLKNRCLEEIVKQKLKLIKKNEFLDTSNLPIQIQQQIDFATIQYFKNSREFLISKIMLYDKLTETLLKSLENKDIFIERLSTEINLKNSEISHLGRIVSLLTKSCN